MEQLPRLQARIGSLKDLRGLVRALRALAASQLQAAQEALDGIRRYVTVVEDAIAEGASLLPEAAREAPVPGVAAPGVLILVCSEHGFVGAFNERLLDRAEELRVPGEDLMIIGRRGAVLAEERGLDVTHSFPMATHIGGVLGVTRRVAEHLTDIVSAKVVFGDYQKNGASAPEARTILPLAPDLLARADSRDRPVYHLPPEDLLQRLAGEYLFAEITRAVMESLVSENGARLQVMGAADHNIGDKLQELGREEQILRQEAVTSELLDVIVGSEAILEPGSGRIM
jgi:F-type H+-transporting ATPase subunit gamma